MTLSAETFEQIIGSVKTDKQTGDERRRSVRVGVRGNVTIYLLRDSDSGLDAAQATVRDISSGRRGGLRSRVLDRGPASQ